MSIPLSVSSKVHFARRRYGRQQLEEGPAPAPPIREPGRVPRVSRLAALAIRFEGLVRSGAIASYAEIAALGHVTRARVSQILNLVNLAPDVLEAVLFLPRTERGRDAIKLAHLQPIALTPDWGKQRRQWRELCRDRGVAIEL
jgi:hypothetical protein